MPKSELRRRIAATIYRTLYWGRNHVPPGLRSVIGVLFMIGGVFGFLPVLGFWMFPLGVAFVALDVPRARHRIDAWMLRLAREGKLDPQQHETPPGAPGDPSQRDEPPTSSQ